MGSQICSGHHISLLGGLNVIDKRARDDLNTNPESVRDRNIGPQRDDPLLCECQVATKNQSENVSGRGSGAGKHNEGSFCQAEVLCTRFDSKSFKKGYDVWPSPMHRCVTHANRELLMPAGAFGSNDDEVRNRKRSKIKLPLRSLAIAACFGGTAGLYKALVSMLTPDFECRWRMLVSGTPQPEAPAEFEEKGPTVLYDRHGAVIATIASRGHSYIHDASKFGSSRKSEPVSPAGIPTWMWQAVVASEDRRFFKHHGVDPRGLARAILSLGVRGGGSTITQQLVKNVFLTNERKWTRKLLEIILSFLLEKQMAKWDILYFYLKKIYWGHGVYGIDEASALYFGKHPSLLTLGECAMLTGIIPAPEFLSPYQDSSRGKKPQARALRRMVEAGFLDSASAIEVLSQPLNLAIESNEGNTWPWKAPYFVSEVLNELNQTYGWTEVVTGGLQVHTTLDLSMQTVAENVIQTAGVEYDIERSLLAERAMRTTQSKLNALQIERHAQITKAVVEAIRRTEEISGDFFKPLEVSKWASELASYDDTSTRNWYASDSGELNVSVAARKAAASVVQQFFAEEECLQGMIVKLQEEIETAKDSRMEAAMVAIDPMSGAVRVLVGGRDFYESHFNRGTQAFRSPGCTFKPLVYLTALASGFKCSHPLMDEPSTIGGFTPENYDLKFRGQVTLEESLVYSLNVPTVRLCAEVGIDKVCDMGRALGIETFLPRELALSLGGCEVTPFQLATVYATIAAGGIYHKPHLITRVETCHGQILDEHEPLINERQVAVVKETAAAELRRLLQVVVERGTGQGARLRRPCAGKPGTSKEHRDVWFAGFTPEISCVVWLGYDDNAPVGGVKPATGATHAAPLWKQFMEIVHEGVPVRNFHDIGSDKHGSRSPTKFEKRLKRPPRTGLREIRRLPQQKQEKSSWKRVFDWEMASIGWEEQEKMQEWADLRATRAAQSQTVQVERRQGGHVPGIGKGSQC